jgi:peptide/nickel transport system ATP-binding protein
MLFVTHNLPLVRSLAQRVAVLADGRLVEFGPTDRVLTGPPPSDCLVGASRAAGEAASGRARSPPAAKP